jgi:protein-tyrosine phosphatase
MTYTVAMVCLGNICRSPMAHVVLAKRLADADLDDRIKVVSSGTSGWHDGKPMDPRSAQALANAGYDPSRHSARSFTTDWYAQYDLLLAMDQQNRADMIDLAPTVAQQSQVRMFRDFDPEASEHDNEVPDPYYGGEEGFAHVLAMVERTVDQLVDHLATVAAKELTQ